MIKLRKGQDKVAEYRNGYMAVPAVPGAGKTTVLAYLTANLIEEGRQGEGKILIVTFMNSAVSNFRQKIGDFLVQRGLSRNRGYEVRTLHSLALNILQEKPEYLLINEDFNIIDPSEKGRILREVIEEWIEDNRALFMNYFDYGAPPGTGRYEKALELWKEEHFPRFIRSIISRLKIRGLDRDELEKMHSRVISDSYLHRAISIFIRYNQIMQRNGFLDFDDLIVQAYNLLAEDDKLCKRLQNKYTYVFEDEAQDSNLLQEKILFKLAGKNGNLVRVGDSNQAIMNTFTASDPEIFRDFCTQENVRKESILVSSRSTKDIIELANHLVKWSVQSHPQKECRGALEEKKIYPVAPDDPFPNPKTSGYTVASNVFSTSEEEIDSISNFAKHHVSKNPDNTVGVLFPSNFFVEKFAEKMEELEVDYESLKSRQKDQLVIIDIFRSLLYYLAHPHNAGALHEVLKFLLNRYSKAEFDEIEEFLSNYLSKFSPEKILYPHDNIRPGEEKIKKSKIFASLTEMLDKINFWLEAGVSLPPDELILLLAEELQLKGEDLAIVQNMALEIRRELNMHPGWDLSRVTEVFPEMENSFRNFARRIYQRKGYEPVPGRVTVTTLHKAKGLEWDTVYIGFLTDSYFPSTLDSDFKGEYYYLEDEYSNPLASALAELDKLMEGKKVKDPRRKTNLDVIEEKLRLLYVGITRARKNLLLTCSRETIFDSGYTREEEPSFPFKALRNFIEEKRNDNGY